MSRFALPGPPQIGKDRSAWRRSTRAQDWVLGGSGKRQLQRLGGIYIPPFANGREGWGTRAVWVRVGENGQRQRRNAGGSPLRFASVEMSHLLGGVRIRGNGRAGWGRVYIPPFANGREGWGTRAVWVRLGRTDRGKGAMRGALYCASLRSRCRIFWVG